MRGLAMAGLLALAACSSSSAEQRPDAPPGKSSVGQAQTESPPPPPGAGGLRPNPMSTGRQTVRGGESFSLHGPTMVNVLRVIYVNQPCPPNVQCIHSGIIKTVEFDVSRDGAHETGTVAMGSPRVLAGIQLQVFDVQPGPVAEVEASLPVVPRMPPSAPH